MMWIYKFLLVVLVFVAMQPASCVQQQDQQSNKPPDLSKFSADQLKLCFDQLKICGADNIYEIGDEFKRRLPQFSTEQLLACFDDWKICGLGEGMADGWPISDELAKRGNLQEVLDHYWKVDKWTIREGIEHVAYHFDNPQVTAFMKRAMDAHPKNKDDYWPVNYLAKKCDVTALKKLSSGRYRNEGCSQYSTSVELFGKCQYRPAIPYLVQDAINDACFNVVESAEVSLHALYPDSPKTFDQLDAMQQYFTRRAQREGFKLKTQKP